MKREKLRLLASAGVLVIWVGLLCGIFIVIDLVLSIGELILKRDLVEPYMRFVDAHGTAIGLPLIFGTGWLAWKIMVRLVAWKRGTAGELRLTENTETAKKNSLR